MDFDETVDQYSGMLGIPPKIIRTDDKVKRLRADRQKRMQAEKVAAMAPQMAAAAKDLGQTPIRGGESTALDALTGALGKMPNNGTPAV